MAAYVEIAKQFGNFLAESNYSAAHALLTKEAQSAYPLKGIQEATENIAPYAHPPGPIQDVGVMEDFILEDWPAKQKDDVAIIYVSLSGRGFCEAVTVTVAREGDNFRIRELEWGRP